MKREDFFLITVLFLLWRIYLFFIAWLGSQIIPFNPSFPYSDVYFTPSGLPQWLWSFANFDGVHYLTIAKTGYSAQFTQVFFPLYPLLISLLVKMMPFSKPIIAGLIISNLFFLLSIFVFFKLLSLDYQRKQVGWIILFFILFPTSLFFGSLYTESLFLFLVLASFYLARKKRWLLAGIFGGLATATRFVGVFLLPALLWEHYNSEFRIQNSEFRKKAFRFTLYALRSSIFYLVPAGLLSYMIYLQLRFGDFLYFWHVQPVFGAGRSGNSFILFPQVVFRYLKIIMTVSPKQYMFWVGIWELGFTLFAAVILLYAYFKKIRLSYLIFSILAVFTPTLTGTFSSMPRYILIAFPIFICLGLTKNRWLKIVLCSLLFVLLSIFTLLFTSGYWVS